jgi:hypothetical protein
MSVHDTKEKEVIVENHLGKNYTVMVLETGGSALVGIIGIVMFMTGLNSNRSTQIIKRVKNKKSEFLKEPPLHNFGGDDLKVQMVLTGEKCFKMANFLPKKYKKNAMKNLAGGAHKIFPADDAIHAMISAEGLSELSDSDMESESNEVDSFLMDDLENEIDRLRNQVHHLERDNERMYTQITQMNRMEKQLSQSVEYVDVLKREVFEARRAASMCIDDGVYNAQATYIDTLVKTNHELAMKLDDALEEAVKQQMNAKDRMNDTRSRKELGLAKEASMHDFCRNWVAANINSISFVHEVCPKCSEPKIEHAHGITNTEKKIPNTNYVADVLILMDDQPWVAVEVAHTHCVPHKKFRGCEIAGNKVFEVDIANIKEAMKKKLRDPWSTQVLCTNLIEPVLCSLCVKKGGGEGVNKLFDE